MATRPNKPACSKGRSKQRPLPTDRVADSAMSPLFAGWFVVTGRKLS